MTKENRATREKMPRKWVQAVFRLGGRKAGEVEGEIVAQASAASAAGASTRLTRTTATTTSETTTQCSSSRAFEEEEREKTAPSSSTRSRASRYRPEWQDSDDDEEERDEREGEERKANGNGHGSSSSSSDDDGDGDEEEEETARAAARLFRTVLVDSLTTSSSKAAEGAAGNSSTSAPLGLETHEVDVGPPLGEVTFLAAPAELRSTLSHTGLLTWPAAPALAGSCSTRGSRRPSTGILRPRPPCRCLSSAPAAPRSSRSPPPAAAAASAARSRRTARLARCGCSRPTLPPIPVWSSRSGCGCGCCRGATRRRRGGRWRLRWQALARRGGNGASTSS